MSKGSGRHGDPADHSKISKLGGKAVFDYYGSKHMATIGRKGGIAKRVKYGKK